MTIRFIISLALIACSPAWGQIEAVDETLTALASGRVVDRRQAFRNEVDWQVPRLRKLLLELCRDDADPIVRERAIERLAESSAGLADLFRDRAENDRNPGPRSAAIVALGRCRRPSDYDFFIDTLKTGGAIGAAAVTALVESGRPEAFKTLAAMLPSCGRDGWLSPAIPKALMELDPERAWPLLIQALIVPETPRYWLAQELKRAEAKGALPRAIELLGHGDPVVRRFAAEIVGAQGDAEAIAPILAASRAHPTERPSYIAALGAIGSARALPVLMKALGGEQKDVETRRAAAAALLRVPPKGREIEIETRLAVEADALVLVRLCELLAQLGDRRSIAALVKLLDDERRSDQPMTISRVMPYPHNVELCDAAGHAVVLLRDGANPMPRSELSVFPADRSETRQADKAGNWWRDLKDKTPFQRKN